MRMKYMSYLERKAQALKNFYFSNKVELNYALISTYIFGIIAHAYGLLNSNYSHDSLNEINAAMMENKMKIWVGRFFVPVLRHLRSSFDVTWIIGLVGFFFIALSSFVICVRIFECKNKAAIIAVSAILATNIVVTTQIVTFSHEFDFNMVSLFLSSTAAFLMLKKSGGVREYSA